MRSATNALVFISALVDHGLSALEGALGSWGGLCVSGRTFVTLLMLSGTKKKK